MSVDALELDRLLNEKFADRNGRVSHVGDEVLLIREVSETTSSSGSSGSSETSELDKLLFRPHRFIWDDVGDLWYPNGLPFTELTLKITWFPRVSKPAVTVMRDRSLIHLQMPVRAGLYEQSRLNERTDPRPANIVMRLNQRMFFLHYELGEGMTPIRELQAIVRDPRGYAQSFHLGRIDNVIVDDTGLDEDPDKDRKIAAAKEKRIRPITPQNEDPHFINSSILTLQVDLRARVDRRDSNQSLSQRAAIDAECCGGGKGIIRFVKEKDPAKDYWEFNLLDIFTANWPVCVTSILEL